MVAAAIVACTLALTTGTPEPAPLEPIGFHVRATDPSTREWLRIGAAESATFRSLLARLVVSDVIVYIGTVDRIVGGSAGQLYFVTATPSVRYVRIELASGGNEREMVSLVAHELQHAVEIAAAPRVRDRQSMALLYFGRGGTSSRSRYDSVDARVTEERVKNELASFRDDGPDAGERSDRALHPGSRSPDPDAIPPYTLIARVIR
jgi:hypothetical protein